VKGPKGRTVINLQKVVKGQDKGTRQLKEKCREKGGKHKVEKNLRMTQGKLRRQVT